jgi:hypothetical protein
MTRNELSTLIKSAKSTAADKAMETAAKLGKPTSTGIAAGAGLGAILAAAGALSRHGEDPSDVSILSNPLLLGALGTAGGYLAGNAFENMPARRANKNISTTALLAMLGGGGTLGNMLAKQDAYEDLNGIVDKSGKRIGGARKKYEDLLAKATASKGKNLKPLAREKELLAGRAKNYSEALRRAGLYEEAAAAGVFRPSKSLLEGILEKARFHPMSPVSWARGAFNTARKGTLLKAFTRPKARIPAAIAGLALLAGGGKAIYDKVHD